jgi:hypothetical protein
MSCRDDVIPAAGCHAPLAVPLADRAGFVLYIPPRMTYLPPKIPPTPKRAAEQRAQRIASILRVVLWVLIVLPLVVMLMIYGYSDQAPAGLRSVVIAADGFFGNPIWALIGPKT